MYVDEDKNFSKIIESINNTTSLIQKFNITFILFYLYISIIIFSTTDLDFVKEASVKLPLLDIKLSIVGIYTVIPILIILTHLSLFIYQFYNSQKIHYFCKNISNLSFKKIREYLQLISFYPQNQMLFDLHFKELNNYYYKFLFLIVNLFFPYFLLFSIQVRFLPYHHIFITHLHRFIILFDLLLIISFCMKIFSTDTSLSFYKLFKKTFKFNFKNIVHSITRFIILLIFVLPLFFSFFVLTLPGEPIERIIGMNFLTNFFCDRYNAIFHRNLDLSNKILINDLAFPKGLYK